MRRPKPPAPRLIDPRNRVALTRHVCEALGVAVGDYVTFEVVGEDVFLRRLDLRVARPPGCMVLIDGPLGEHAAWAGPYGGWKRPVVVRRSS
jgi:hypothetical protein